jgi:hypothetical protein
MTTEVKTAFLETLGREFGPLRRLEGSQSLYEVGEGVARIYVRYSRVHNGTRTFFGLREADLRRLEGHPSILCFLWDGQAEPLLVPFDEYEDVFQSVQPAQDGQYKVQVLLQRAGAELYIARAGRFNVEGHLGLDALRNLVDSTGSEAPPELTHPQVQSFLGTIGAIKGYDVWAPASDRTKLQAPPGQRIQYRGALPHGFGAADGVLQEVDVVWIQRGSSELKALFEVEHSTAVYSGLLRLNDIHLVAPTLRATFSIVANETRRSLFTRQLNRPTFQASGLCDLCTFLKYSDVFGWYRRLVRDTDTAKR